MKKSTFYQCGKKANKIIVAIKVEGYSEGEIGVHKDTEKGWMATHIPTGVSLGWSARPTRRDALSMAKDYLAKMVDFDQKLQDHLNSETYADFLNAKKEEEKC